MNEWINEWIKLFDLIQPSATYKSYESSEAGQVNWEDKQPVGFLDNHLHTC